MRYVSEPCRPIELKIVLDFLSVFETSDTVAKRNRKLSLKQLSSALSVKALWV